MQVAGVDWEHAVIEMAAMHRSNSSTAGQSVANRMPCLVPLATTTGWLMTVLEAATITLTVILLFTLLLFVLFRHVDIMVASDLRMSMPCLVAAMASLCCLPLYVNRDTHTSRPLCSLTMYIFYGLNLLSVLILTVKTKRLHSSTRAASALQTLSTIKTWKINPEWQLLLAVVLTLACMAIFQTTELQQRTDIISVREHPNSSPACLCRWSYLATKLGPGMLLTILPVVCLLAYLTRHVPLLFTELRQICCASLLLAGLWIFAVARSDLLNGDTHTVYIIGVNVTQGFILWLSMFLPRLVRLFRAIPPSEVLNHVVRLKTVVIEDRPMTCQLINSVQPATSIRSMHSLRLGHSSEGLDGVRKIPLQGRTMSAGFPSSSCAPSKLYVSRTQSAKAKYPMDNFIPSPLSERGLGNTLDFARSSGIARDSIDSMLFKAKPGSPSTATSMESFGTVKYSLGKTASASAIDSIFKASLSEATSTAATSLESGSLGKPGSASTTDSILKTSFSETGILGTTVPSFSDTGILTNTVPFDSFNRIVYRTRSASVRGSSESIFNSPLTDSGPLTTRASFCSVGKFPLARARSASAMSSTTSLIGKPLSETRSPRVGMVPLRMASRAPLKRTKSIENTSYDAAEIILSCLPSPFTRRTGATITNTPLQKMRSASISTCVDHDHVAVKKDLKPRARSTSPNRDATVSTVEALDNEATGTGPSSTNTMLVIHQPLSEQSQLQPLLHYHAHRHHSYPHQPNHTHHHHHHHHNGSGHPSLSATSSLGSTPTEVFLSPPNRKRRQPSLSSTCESFSFELPSSDEYCGSAMSGWTLTH